MSRQFIIDEFVSQLGLALEMVAGERPSITLQSAPEPGGEPTRIIWEQRFSIDGGAAWIAGALDAWTGAGSRLLAASGVDDGDAATAKSTILEVLNQAFAGVARVAGERIQKAVTTAGAAEIPELPGSQNWSGISIQFTGSPAQLFWLAFNEPMRDLVPVPAPLHDRHSRSLGNPARPITAAIENSKTLDLLLDVELPVSVSFGRAQLSLKDVIKLTTGSIVELNRTIGEPVEIIVNNCVIARGEVVVVEGNFGVRIQHVISKQDRLRTLY